MSKRSLVLALLMLCAATGAAQVAKIGGTVKDSSGAVIPGVRITVHHQPTNRNWETVTDEGGKFSVQGVPTGDIRVTAELPGFRTSIQEVTIGGTDVEISITLLVAAVTETIQVTSSLPSVETSMASLAATTQSARNANQRRRDVVYRGPMRMNTESYDYIQDNAFIRVSQHPRSTFATDVDTASYSNVRRFLNEASMPPTDAVRIEELVNYFSYSYAPPKPPDPVVIHTEVAAPFWKPNHRLVKIAIRAADVDISERKPVNLVFLIDVSGSMVDDAKLPLVRRSLHLLVDQLKDEDRVAMVVYAGSSGLVLPPTAGNDKDTIHNAIERLAAGGSTNGGEGIRLAYEVARRGFVADGMNRVILATDGDFNIGVTNEGELVRLIEKNAASGVFLSVLGYGMGNYKDSTLEKLADKGHGNYAYIDTFNEAKRVLVEQMTSTLLTVAKDVKLQIEFNPSEVQAYRLLGYENRLLADEDFNDDAKQGGDIGAGQVVTAFYEIVPKGVAVDSATADPLKYQEPSKTRKTPKGELLTVSLRYKTPRGRSSSLIRAVVTDTGIRLDRATADFRFASAVAAFGMLLRDSPHKGATTFDSVFQVADDAVREKPSKYGTEFLELVARARALRASTSQH